jgi:hypothetical protein
VHSDFDANRRSVLLSGTSLLALSAVNVTCAQAQPAPAAATTPPQPANAGGKPNILVIWGDDIGVANISAYSNGLMGYETPNIDRIAREASSSSTTTASSRAPRGVQRSSPASTSFEPD